MPSRPLAIAAALIFAGTTAFAAVGPAVPPVRAGSATLAGPVLTVARGTTSAGTSGWSFFESYPAEFPASGFAIVITIRPDSGSPDGISFVGSSTPVFTGPGSLNGSAELTGPRTLRITLKSSAPGQLESFSVTGLRLKASETAGLGPVVATYVTEGFAGNFGPLPPIANTGGGTATPSPSPTATPAPSPSPTTTPMPGPPALSTAAARVAAGRPGAYTTTFRSVLTTANGAQVTVRATVRPIDVGRTIGLYRRFGTSGTWRHVAAATVGADGDAFVVTRASLPARWTGAREVQFRWFAGATATATSAWSDVARVIVR